MTSKAGLPLTSHISSKLSIGVLSGVAGLLVSGLAIFMQWLIYDDWLHDRGPMRIVGSAVAGALMFAICFRWQINLRERRLELLHRFETIRWMNDRIRNSLQAIECVTYAADPQATQSVRAAVDTIECVLAEVLAGAHEARLVQPAQRTESVTTR